MPVGPVSMVRPMQPHGQFNGRASTQAEPRPNSSLELKLAAWDGAIAAASLGALPFPFLPTHVAAAHRAAAVAMLASAVAEVGALLKYSIVHFDHGHNRVANKHLRAACVAH